MVYYGNYETSRKQRNPNNENFLYRAWYKLGTLQYKHVWL